MALDLHNDAEPGADRHSDPQRQTGRQLQNILCRIKRAATVLVHCDASSSGLQKVWLSSARETG
jgi:hypothetical protein